eukprot:TRINITY_DN11211_c0_g1_i1.p1 TRINITY_DN11211_c0_g1~~TRINITY_DN11211_c0_g1_i1.p1  ORF type:complete len:174 (+),score=38.24 TRINITY_DN11211_c0_g1_i1:356-877(+)
MGDSPALEWITTLNDSMEFMDRMCGPRQDHLQLELEIRVENPCRVRNLRVGGGKECVEFTVPARAFEEDTMYPLSACGIHWTLELLPSGTSTTVLVSSTRRLPEGEAYELTVLFRHPTSPTLSMETTRTTWVRAGPQGLSRCTVVYTWSPLTGRDAFAWPSGDFVLRCVLQRL